MVKPSENPVKAPKSFIYMEKSPSRPEATKATF